MPTQSGEPYASAREVCQALEDDIVNGRTLPGTRLEEPALARRFGISRTPVREALQLLAATELVEKRPGRGVFVTLVTSERLSSMFEAMAELEATIGRLAAERMTVAERATLERTHYAMARTVCEGIPVDYERQNRSFHDALYRGARSPVLVELTRSARRRVAPFRRVQFNTLSRLASSHDEHGRIVDAILQGATERTFRELHAHIMSVHDVAQDYLASLHARAASRP